MPDRDELARALTDVLQAHALEVEAALSAHVDWKRRLRDAVSRGYCEIDSDEAGREDFCSLGRWLHSLQPTHGADPWCEEVVQLHARFHSSAAAVVQLIEQGRIDEARAAMDGDADFARASEELVGRLESWRHAA
jgi:hypothetical protein